jgi:hypothetical protein
MHGSTEDVCLLPFPTHMGTGHEHVLVLHMRTWSTVPLLANIVCFFSSLRIDAVEPTKAITRTTVLVLKTMSAKPIDGTWRNTRSLRLHN